MFGAGNDRQFISLCRAIDRPELSSDPRFSTNAARVQHRTELVNILQSVFETRTTDEWMLALRDTGMPHGPVNNIAQTFAHPQVRHREMVAEVQHPQAGKIKLVGMWRIRIDYSYAFVTLTTRSQPRRSNTPTLKRVSDYHRRCTVSTRMKYCERCSHWMMMRFICCAKTRRSSRHCCSCG